MATTASRCPRSSAVRFPVCVFHIRGSPHLEAAARIAKLNAEADELFALHDQGLPTQQDKTKISICLLVESVLKTEILKRIPGDRWSHVGDGYLLEIKPTGLIPGELRVDVSRIVDEVAA